jgi:cob(I)alamin adenosyltransferase
MEKPFMKMQYSKKGDAGETSLMGGQRISKCDGRPETYGTLDEASSALGIARACSSNSRTKEIILSIQKDLAVLGAELATLPEDALKFPYRITTSHVQSLERLITDLQDEVTIAKEFIYPGANMSSAAIDLARTIIRRGERNAVRLMQEKIINNEDILRFFNRLADLLFTLARYEEGNIEDSPKN